MFFPLTLLTLGIFFLLPLLVLLFQIHLAETALVRLGISPMTGITIIYGSLIGSLINIPLYTRDVSPLMVDNFPFDFIGFPFNFMHGKQIIAINLGGALIPLALCVYLFPKAPLFETILGITVSSFIAYKLARPVPYIGITLPILIPPLVAVLLAGLLAPSNPAPVAFISGVLGVLIGADLLNIRTIQTPGMMSIGGAGVYDGIFLVGILTGLLA